MWIENMNIEIKSGLGWIPLIENFLQIADAIENHSGFPDCLHSVRTEKGSLQIDSNLPINEGEQAILGAVLNEWAHRTCEVCGEEGTHRDEKTRCSKHSDSTLSTLSSVKSVTNPGIPTFRKGAYVVCKVSGEGFLVIEYRYPKRFLPPTKTGSCIDQTHSPFDIICDKKTGREKVLAAKNEEDMDLLILDIESYNELCEPEKLRDVSISDYPALLDMSKAVEDRVRVTRREAYKAYLQNLDVHKLASLESHEKVLVKGLFEEFDTTEIPYVTGISSLSLAPPDSIEALSRKGPAVISGIHIDSTWPILGNEGLYESHEGLRRVGAILPNSLIANHERAIFDELYGRIQGVHERICVPDFVSEVIDFKKVEMWINESLIPDYRKLIMLKALGDLSKF